MNKIKISILLYIGIFFLSYALFSCKGSQQVIENNKLDEDRTVYWFYVKLREVKVKNSELTAYSIQRLGSQPEKGTVKQYNYLLWDNLSKGTKFAVGPFNNPEEAKQAFIFYKIQKDPHATSESFDKAQKVFWFVLHINFRERSVSMDLERIPAAIASGNYADFDVFLKENLDVRVMTIGPFRNMPDAEESKRIYRLH